MVSLSAVVAVSECRADTVRWHTVAAITVILNLLTAHMPALCNALYFRSDAKKASEY